MAEEGTRLENMEDICRGLHPAVDGQSLKVLDVIDDGRQLFISCLRPKASSSKQAREVWVFPNTPDESLVIPKPSDQAVAGTTDERISVWYLLPTRLVELYEREGTGICEQSARAGPKKIPCRKAEGRDGEVTSGFWGRYLSVQVEHDSGLNMTCKCR
ncbi:hypothetical protein PoB_004470800 [Plakobranchus ocellatus]|uniref:Uncharacterized protein n=1 Tax=Plakobranchus ocellatus TaxID=259542 RepID=A0AAV4BF30_9GAST|nr:hypothetical protein PoB_004470800 [Plakobranchus ocellatus]